LRVYWGGGEGLVGEGGGSCFLRIFIDFVTSVFPFFLFVFLVVRRSFFMFGQLLFSVFWW